MTVTTRDLFLFLARTKYGGLNYNMYVISLCALNPSEVLRKRTKFSVKLRNYGNIFIL